MSKIQKQVANATKWSSITEIVAKLISPITNMILARLLTPEAFGAVATINIVISFSELFTDAGFQKYIIQRDFKSEKELEDNTNVAFWTNFSLSFFIWMIIIWFRNPIATLVGSSDLGNGIAVASAAIVIFSFSSIQMARLRRAFDFKTLFYVRMVTSLIPLVITVPLAYILRSYWALIFGTLASQVARAIILLKNSVWKPKCFYSIKCFKEMFSYSMWTMFESVAIWLTSYIGTFIVSTALDSYYLGIYKTSMTTVNAYMTIITSATTPVLFSTLSRLQNDEKEYREMFFKFQRLVALFVIPMGAGIYLYRELVTLILLGAQWEEATGLMGLWGLTSGITIIFSHYNSEIFRSKGKPKISLLVQVLHLAVLVPTLIWASDKGFETIYHARCIARLQLPLVSTIVLWIGFKIKPWEIAKNVWPSILGTVVMSGMAIFLQGVSGGIVWQFVSIGICIIVYFIVVMLSATMRKELLGTAKSFLTKLKKRK